MYSSEPLPHLVEHYLAYLHEVYPTAACFDGVHTHDDLLEDFSRSAIDAHLREIGSFERRLAAIDPESLTPVQRVERPILEAHIRAKIHDLDAVRAWERNPLLYAETLALSLAAQVLFAYAPAAERARRILSKLRQTPRLIQSARENVKDPPGIFVKTAVETLRGVRAFIDRDLPRGIAEVDDLSLLGDLADAAAEAGQAIGAYAEHLEQEVAPKARGSFRLGRDRLEAKLRLEEGIDLDVDRLLAIGQRELAATKEAFREAAAKLGAKERKDPAEVWRAIKDRHPAPGELVPTAQAQVDELRAFLERHKIVSIPDGAPVVVGPTPQFYRWTFASMWMPGPFEVRPLRSYYYLTDADPAWPAERQEEYLRDFNHATLWAITAHEVYPGHFLHFQHVRQVESTLRKSQVFAPMSFVEGWAHYAEQLVVEQGGARKDPARRLGQLAEALVRLARLIVGIRLHAEDLSVEQGVRLFREDAYLEEPSARREAERGTFDPTYGVYALGRLMMLKLRRDAEAAQGDGRFSLKDFHDTVLGQGLAPFWAHRRLLLPGDQGPVLE